MKIKKYQDLKDILTYKLNCAGSFEKMTFDTLEKEGTLLITRKIPGNKKYLYEIEINQEKHYEGNSSTKEKLFLELQKKLTKLGFKEKEDITLDTNLNLELPENNENESIDKIIDLYQSVRNDDFIEACKILEEDSENFTLNELKELDDEASAITEKKNNSKYVERYKNLSRLINRFKSSIEKKQKQEELKKEIAELSYRRNKIIEPVIKNLKKEIAESKDMSVSYMESFKTLLQDHPSLLDSLKIQKDRLTYEERKLFVDELTKDLPFKSAMIIEEALGEILVELRDKKALERNERYIYQISTDEGDSLSKNQRLRVNSLEEARNIVKTLQNQSTSTFIEIEKIQINKNGSVNTFREPISIYMREKGLFNKLTDTFGELSAMIWAIKKGKVSEFENNVVKELTIGNYRINLKKEVTMKKLVNAIKDKTKDQIIYYLISLFDNVTHDGKVVEFHLI